MSKMSIKSGRPTTIQDVITKLRTLLPKSESVKAPDGKVARCIYNNRIVKTHPVYIWNDKRKNDRRIKIGVLCEDVDTFKKMESALGRLGVAISDGGICRANYWGYSPRFIRCLVFTASLGGEVKRAA